MEPIAVHPVEGSVWDSIALEFTFRLRVIDVATGELLCNAYAEKPVADKAVLERRGVHPFRVLKPRRVKFSDDGNKMDVQFDIPTLRTFVKDPASTKENKKLKESWKVVGEFFPPHPDKETVVSADGKTQFVRVRTADERYVCVKDAAATYAERGLITNCDGMLLVPLTFMDWGAGTKLTFKFRDYMLLKAQGDFAPEKLIDLETKAGGPVSDFGYKSIKVALEGDPGTNTWSATVGTKKESFVDELAVDTAALSFEEIDLTVWAVRRVKPLSEVVAPANIAAGSGNNSRAGIMIHYNSGYYMYELRPDAAHRELCRNAYTNRENRYMMDVRMALGILKYVNDAYNTATGSVGRLGYHYHIGQNGAIMPAVSESLRIWHAGETRETTPVEAIENVDKDPRTKSKVIASPKSNLNASYIGIDILGNHNGGYEYTKHQHWYLDRLIENIQARLPAILWYHIQGHDETRAAYNANATVQKDAKADPGAALDGGMTRLRGRHGATFP